MQWYADTNTYMYLQVHTQVKHNNFTQSHTLLQTCIHNIHTYMHVNTYAHINTPLVPCSWRSEQARMAKSHWSPPEAVLAHHRSDLHQPTSTTCRTNQQRVCSQCVCLRARALAGNRPTGTQPPSRRPRNQTLWTRVTGNCLSLCRQPTLLRV